MKTNEEIVKEIHAVIIEQNLRFSNAFDWHEKYKLIESNRYFAKTQSERGEIEIQYDKGIYTLTINNNYTSIGMDSTTCEHKLLEELFLMIKEQVRDNVVKWL